MATLTTDEITYCKNLKKINDLEKDIQAINDAAFSAVNAKHAEIDALEAQRVADVQIKQDQIDALNA
jgi:hypothetical protein